MKYLSLSDFSLALLAYLSEQAQDASMAPESHVAALDEHLQEFQRRSLLLLGDARTVEDARYLLCAVADEWMLERMGLGWSRHSLLVKHYGEAHGGERCWAVLHDLLAQGALAGETHKIHLLGLYEQVIGFGWRGRYRSLIDGEERIHELRQDLHDRLHAGSRSDTELKALVAHSVQHVRRRQNIWLKSAALAMLVSAVLGIWLVDMRLERQWSEVAQGLEKAIPVLAPLAQGGRP